MNQNLNAKLKALGAAGASAVALAVAFGAYYEGTGTTRKRADGSLEYQAYRDPVGIWTACHGVTGTAIVPHAWYTQAQCDALESGAYSVAEAGARRLFHSYDKLNRWQQLTLLDMVYNVGESKLSDSTLRRKLNAGDVRGACDEMDRWVKGRVAGKLVTLPGLVDRRVASQDICMNWKD